MAIITRPPSGTALRVKEADNAPNVASVSTLIVTNGTLTDNTGGSVSLTTGGGAGGSGLNVLDTYDVGLTQNTLACNQIMRWAAVRPHTALTVTTMQANLNTVSGSPNVMELGIYDTSFNLLSSGTFSASAAGYFTVTLGVSVALSADTTYLLAALDRNNNIGTLLYSSYGFTNDTKISGNATGQATMPATIITPNGAQDTPWIRAY